METLKIQVRYNGQYHEMFFYDQDGLNCFSFVEGHSEACESYRLRKCEPVSLEVAQGYVNRMQAYYNSVPGEKIKLELVQKLRNK